MNHLFIYFTYLLVIYLFIYFRNVQTHISETGFYGRPFLSLNKKIKGNCIYCISLLHLYCFFFLTFGSLYHTILREKVRTASLYLAVLTSFLRIVSLYHAVLRKKSELRDVNSQLQGKKIHNCEKKTHLLFLFNFFIQRWKWASKGFSESCGINIYNSSYSTNNYQLLVSAKSFYIIESLDF